MLIAGASLPCRRCVNSKDMAVEEINPVLQLALGQSVLELYPLAAVETFQRATEESRHDVSLTTLELRSTNGQATAPYSIASASLSS